MDIRTDNGPALWYVTTSGGIVRLDDVADLTRMAERERAIAAAVVNHAVTRIATAGYELMTGITSLNARSAEQPGEAL